jgi:hypothetical protein
MTNKIDATEFSAVNNKDLVRRLALPRSSAAKAIRAKCLDCCGGSQSEVARCHITACSLWPFRFGKDPWRVASNPDGPARKAVE